MPLFERLADSALHDGIVICRGKVPPCKQANAIAWTDGLAVIADGTVSDDIASWAAAHLYGHCMAWTDATGLREWDLSKNPRNTTLDEIARYEASAGDFGLYLLYKVARELEPWFRFRSEQDWVLYMHHLIRVDNYPGPIVSLPQFMARAPRMAPKGFDPGWAFNLR
jgi:hypothetical protein